MRKDIKEKDSSEKIENSKVLTIQTLQDVHLTTRGANRRKKILEIAAQLFREYGFAGVSINEVVRQSGGSLSTVYKIFGSKEGLFVEVFTETMKNICQEFLSIQVEKESFSEELECLFKKLYEYHPENLMRLFLFDGLSIPLYRDRVLQIINDYLQNPFVELLEKMAKRHHIQFRIATQDLVLILVRLLRGTVMEMIIDQNFNRKRVQQSTELTITVIRSLILNSEGNHSEKTENL